MNPRVLAFLLPLAFLALAFQNCSRADISHKQLFYPSLETSAQKD